MAHLDHAVFVLLVGFLWMDTMLSEIACQNVLCTNRQRECSNVILGIHVEIYTSVCLSREILNENLVSNS